MTFDILVRFLPRPLALVLAAVIYAALLALVLLLVDGTTGDFVYTRL